jgi:predicted GIY-YIG superfamily endonuclease
MPAGETRCLHSIEPIEPIEPVAPASGPHFCYILHNAQRPQSTYNGYTVDTARRLRQHNGELAGGAKATARHVARGGTWRVLAVVTSPLFTHHTALSFEWHCRYPTCRRPRPGHLQGPAGRLRGLALALAHRKFAHLRDAPDAPVAVRVDAAWMGVLTAALAGAGVSTADVSALPDVSE